MEQEIASTGPHWLQILAWLATLALVGIAGYALYFTYNQVLAARERNEAAARQARATFLLKLDQRWDGPVLAEARRLVYEIRDDVAKGVANKHPRLDDRARGTKISEGFAERLAALLENDVTKYLSIMHFCGFFETVGLMVRQGYVPIDDITHLFKGPILDVEKCFRAHIEQRQNETGVPKGLFENALDLVDTIKNAEG